MPPQYALAYLDDIIVFSRSVEDHLAQLRKVLEVHRQFGMKLKLSKCRVLQTEVEYLGHLVSEEGIRMIPGYGDPWRQKRSWLKDQNSHPRHSHTE